MPGAPCISMFLTILCNIRKAVAMQKHLVKSDITLPATPAVDPFPFRSTLATSRSRVRRARRLMPSFGELKAAPTLNAVLFLIAVFVQIFTIQYESEGMLSKLKYFVCGVGIVVGLLTMAWERACPVMLRELGKVLSIVVVFLVITGLCILDVGYGNERTIVEVMLMSLPIIYAFTLINTLRFQQINICMMAVLLVSIVAYFANLHMTPSQIISALLSVNPTASYSALESSSFAGISIALALYYLYFRRNKLGCVLSFVFVFLTFKRLAMVTALVLLILPRFLDCSKPVSRRMLRLAKVTVFTVSLLYFWLMTPALTSWMQTQWNFDLDSFTMARSWRFRLVWDDSAFVNTGLGSTWSFLDARYGFSMEMDIIRLFIEVTPIGVAIFVNNMFDLVSSNRYCFIVMLYLFFNLITSHSLANMFSWLMYYIIFGTIIYRSAGHAAPRLLLSTSVLREKRFAK